LALSSDAKGGSFTPQDSGNLIQSLGAGKSVRLNFYLNPGQALKGKPPSLDIAGSTIFSGRAFLFRGTKGGETPFSTREFSSWGKGAFYKGGDYYI